MGARANGIVDNVSAGEVARFIPIRRSDLLNELLRGEYWLESDHDIDVVEIVLHSIGRLRQVESAVTLDKLMDAYHPFNPDDFMKLVRPLPAEQRGEGYEDFMKRVQELAYRANFEPIGDAALARALELTSPVGVPVDVDLADFSNVCVYYRGKRVREYWKRDWRWAYLFKRQYKVPSYDHTFVAFSLKASEERIVELMHEKKWSRGVAEQKFLQRRKALPNWVKPEHCYLKLFKDIPKYDIDMLLPYHGVKFRLVDQVVLVVSGVFGIIYTIIVAIAKILLAVAISPLPLVAFVFPIAGTAFRQIMSWLNTRTRYTAELVQKLYFYSLSNNHCTLAVLNDEAEEEDLKEDWLLYVFLISQSTSGINLEKAKSDIEAFLLRKFCVKVKFDHKEAFERLRKRRLSWGDPDGNGIGVLAPAEAVEHLSRLWIEALDFCSRR